MILFLTFNNQIVILIRKLGLVMSIQYFDCKIEFFFKFFFFIYLIRYLYISINNANLLNVPNNIFIGSLNCFN